MGGSGLILTAIAWLIYASFFVQGNWTKESIQWAALHGSVVYDSNVKYGSGFCDCEATPAVAHIPAFGLNKYTVLHEFQHIWDWKHDLAHTQGVDTRVTDAMILALRIDRVGDLARRSLARKPAQPEHLNTDIIEGLNYKIGPVPEWYRQAHAANIKPIYTIYLPLGES